MQIENGMGAVITGGASGIGLATAERLGQQGVRVALADVEERALNAAVDQLSRLGIEAHAIACDVRDRRQVEQLADDAFARLGNIEMVFNNAGVTVGGPVSAMTHDDWRWIVDVNLWGPIHGVEAFLPRMIESGRPGHLLFTASFAGLVPNVGLGPYCVTKYGVVALAEVLSKELRGNGIGVTVVCPMRVATNINESDRNRPVEYGGRAGSPSIPDFDEENPGRAASDGAERAGRILDVGLVADMIVRAVADNELYVVTHAESRDPVRRRFARIERAFDRALPVKGSSLS